MIALTRYVPSVQSNNCNFGVCKKVSSTIQRLPTYLALLKQYFEDPDFNASLVR
jgi:hypothetical protein